MNKPNVLFIMTDQQNVHTLGCYGNRAIETPHIDRLAAAGAVFENTYVTIPLCVPSRASIWSSQYPHQSGVMVNDDGREVRLPAEVDTIGDVAKREGYTCGYFGKWHIGQDRVPQHGFSDAWWTHLRGSYEQFLEERQNFDFPPVDAPSVLGKRLAQRAHVPFEEAHDTVVTTRTIEFIREKHESPFLAVCSLRAPHDPYVGPFDAYYDPDDVTLPNALAETFENKPQLQTAGIPRQWFRDLAGETATGFDEHALRRVIARYWGMMRMIDLNVGRLVETLEELDIAEDTVVVYMSDHGEMMGAHRLFSKGNFMYDEATKVPLIMRWPGRVPAGVRVEGLTSTIDVVPTLLDLMDLPQPPSMIGQSARQLWDYSFNERDAIFMEMFESYGLFNPVFSVRTRRWKFNWYVAGLDELYDMEADPHELENLASDARHADTIVGLRARISSWLAETNDIRLSDLARISKSFQTDF